MKQEIEQSISNSVDQLTKDDIMVLLETALKENDPFAKEFADRVAPHIARLVQRNIDVSPVKLDGTGLGKHLTQTLQNTTEDKVKNISNEISEKYKNVAEDLLQRIGKNINDPKLIKINPVVDLKGLFTTADSKLTNTPFIGYGLMYQSMMRKILSRIQSAIPKEKDGFKFAEDGKSIKLTDIFKPDASFGRYTKFRYMWLVNSLIGKISRAVKDVSFKFSGTDITEKGKVIGTEHEIKLTDIFNVDKQSSLYTKHQYNKTIRDIIKKLKTTILDKIDSITWPTDSKGFLGSLGLSFSPQSLGGRATNQFRSVMEETPEVIVSDFGREATEKLEDLLTRALKKQKNVEKPTPKKEDNLKDFLERIKDKFKNLLLLAPGIKTLLDTLKSVPWKQIGKNIASGATDLLLAKYAIDLGRMYLDPKFREQKEENLARDLTDPNKSALQKIATGILNLPAAITGYTTQLERVADAESEKINILLDQKKWSENRFGKEAVEKSIQAALNSDEYKAHIQSIKERNKKAEDEENIKLSKQAPMSVGSPGAMFGVKPMRVDYTKKTEEEIDEYTEEIRRQAAKGLNVQKFTNKQSMQPITQSETQITNDISQQTTKNIGPAQQDFIWRAGEKVTPFDKKDNIVSTKDPEIFERLVQAVNQPAYSSKFVSRMDNTDKVLSDLVVGLNTLIKQMKSEPAGNKMMSSGIPTTEGSLAAVDASTRDPAYILRSRAWDRLREGYVVI